MPETPVSAKDTGVVVSAAGTGFPRTARVRAKAEFARVFESGVRRAEPAFALHWLAGVEGARLGLAVSRKVDRRAVGRNRIKRVLRETFRHLRPQLAPGSYVVVARPAAAAADGATLRAAFLAALRRARALPLDAPDGTMPASPISPTPAPPGA